MMNTPNDYSVLADNLQKLIFYLQLSKKEFAQSIGISPNSLSNILHRRAKPTFEILNNIGLKHGVRLDWLVFNKGSMYDETPAYDRLDGQINPQIFKAISARLILADMVRLGIAHAGEIAESLLQGQIPNADTLSAEAQHLNETIWHLNRHEEKLAEIYNEVISLESFEEKLEMMTQKTLAALLNPQPPQDFWAAAVEQMQMQRHLRHRLNTMNLNKETGSQEN